MGFVHGQIPRAGAAALVAALALVVPAAAGAAPVLVMGAHGHVTARQDPFLLGG